MTDTRAERYERENGSLYDAMITMTGGEDRAIPLALSGIFARLGDLIVVLENS